MPFVFEDEHFPINHALGRELNAKYAPNIVWIRASECPGASLLGAKIAPEDVLEGELDDCYLVSALTLLALQPSLVRSLFNLAASNKEEGRYCVCLWRQGERLEIQVDDRIPCHVSTRTPVFARCRGATGFWVQIVEKAFAKLYGSYSSLAGGNTAEALHDLTGRPVFDYNLEAPDVRVDIREGRLWSELQEHIEARSMVACSFFVPSPRVAHVNYFAPCFPFCCSLSALCDMDKKARKGLIQDHTWTRTLHSA
jgi:hypothetical protein